MKASVAASICLVLSLWIATSARAQVRGELRLSVVDPQGAAVMAQADIVSRANQYQRSLSIPADGRLLIRNLPFGKYTLTLHATGFGAWEQTFSVQSEVPTNVFARLSLAQVATAVQVTDAATPLDTQGAGTVYSVGRQAIAEKLPNQLGRQLSDLVNEQPGWLYEANGVLHPRGSEYDVQYVVNGLPVTQNRSPAFAPMVDADDLESVRVFTSGYPAEYGRKLGGVIELTTTTNQPAGFHGLLNVNGGSFRTAGGSAVLSYAQGKNVFAGTADGFHTDRYLDPPVLENFTNNADGDNFSGSYERDISERDRIRISLARNSARFLVPNELVQQQAGQQQHIRNDETDLQVHYQHVVSPNLLLMLSGSVRDANTAFDSNALATPVVVMQERGYRETYAGADVSGHHGKHDWKFGVDAIFGPVHELLAYTITDPAQFEPGTQQRFRFADRRRDAEPSMYVQDEIHVGRWNVSAGIRLDDYRFIVSQTAWSPRVGIARSIPLLKMVVHASYDRIFQTPAMENLLLASSPQLNSLNPVVVRLPVRPSHANYYEVGFTTTLFGKIRLDGNVFRRDFSDYPDDDVLLDTGVSFPIAFAHARVSGEELRLELPLWKRVTASLSYANQVGSAHGPITGGLFVGSAEANDLDNTDRFPISQDQRNSAHARLRWQVFSRAWLSTGAEYGSGLPAEIGDQDKSTLLAQFGSEILGRVNLERGRVRPNFAMDLAAGADLYQDEKRKVEVQIASFDITDRLNVINFAGVFSGTAVAPQRSLSARVKVTF